MGKLTPEELAKHFVKLSKELRAKKDVSDFQKGRANAYQHASQEIRMQLKED